MSSNSSQSDEKCLKCIFVGNAAVGKTSMIVSYTTNGYPHNYIPTAFDNFSVVVLVDKKPIRLQLHDTAGQSSFDTLRPLCYTDADVFVIVYSVVNIQSFDDVIDHWYPEVTRKNNGVKIILVGTQIDQRWQMRSTDTVSTQRGKHVAQQIGAEFYECSALTQHNLKEMFDSAILAGLESAQKRAATAANNRSRFYNKSTKIKERVAKFITRTRNLI
ncbi:unnamed protein product [Caenorhabditis angaria]|uniref:Uncharacterized protein n=1 Tax=Caenorhabditis angaria TaxID=860376 RepID=A0A9P1N3F5_9PELO|nr:unnamed protein product [Caenorhabditis angaria]